MKKMSNKLKQECIGVIHDYANVLMSVEQFDELMQENAALNDDLIKYNSPRDTMDRDALIDALAVKLVGRPWPMYGSGAEYSKQFFHDYTEAIASFK